MTGVELIAEERKRQIDIERWTAQHDDGHTLAQIALAGLSYVSVAASQVRLGEGCLIHKLPVYWPWDDMWWKPSNDPVRNLTKAGALIAAEIDRLQRKQQTTKSHTEEPMQNFIEEAGWPQVHGETSSVKFTIQSGPVKEHGVNGCQIDDVIVWAKEKIEGFNATFPCRENALALTKLDEALLWLQKRKNDREKRNVEGTSKA